MIETAIVLSVAAVAHAQIDYDRIGRIFAAPGETAYLATNVEGVDVFETFLDKRRGYQALLESGETADAKANAMEVEKSRQAVINLTKAKTLTPLEPGVLVYRIGKAEGGLKSGGDVWKVVILNGRNKGQVGYTSLFMTLEPSPGESCFIYPVSNHKYAFGAFEEFSLDSFWDAIYKGNQDRAAGLIVLREVFPVDRGTRGTVVDSGEGCKQIRLTSGKHKGKLLWIDAGGIFSTDMDVVARALSEYKRSIKQHPTKQ
jgi:hypothetical protein